MLRIWQNIAVAEQLATAETESALSAHDTTNK